jgi:hypothetical protein
MKEFPFFHAVAAYSKQHLITTFFDCENAELFGVRRW